VQWLVVKAMFLQPDALVKAQSRRNSYGPSVVIIGGSVVVCVHTYDAVQTYRQSGLGG
jgi:hypothetical protein